MVKEGVCSVVVWKGFKDQGGVGIQEGSWGQKGLRGPRGGLRIWKGCWEGV